MPLPRLWQDCHIQPKFVQLGICAPLFGLRPLSAGESKGTMFVIYVPCVGAA
jgi:hypothetical protein